MRKVISLITLLLVVLSFVSNTKVIDCHEDKTVSKVHEDCHGHDESKQSNDGPEDSHSSCECLMNCCAMTIAVNLKTHFNISSPVTIDKDEIDTIQSSKVSGYIQKVFRPPIS